MDYWTECIEEALEDAGLHATKEQIEIVASWVDGAHENFGLATGSEFIPDPVHSELDEVKREMKKQQERHERQLNGVCQGVARRRGVDVGAVNIDSGGEVTYDV